MQKITKNNSIVHSKSTQNGSTEEVLFKDAETDGKTILSVGKKVFQLSDHDNTFLLEKNHHWVSEKKINFLLSNLT